MINIFTQSQQTYLNYINSHYPDAISYIQGNKNFPNIEGKVEFYKINKGVLVLAEIKGLPQENETGEFFAMHIHNGDNCYQDADGNFENTGHLNPENKNHPNHMGDLPVILSNDGYAYSINLTNRFSILDIIGKTVMIHQNADDFRTNPSGNSGTKIACGVIVKKC